MTLLYFSRVRKCAFHRGPRKGRRSTRASDSIISTACHPRSWDTCSRARTLVQATRTRSYFSLHLKNFPAFLFPYFSILGFSEIHAELHGNLFKRQLAIVRSVVAEICDHLDLLKIEVRGVRFWSSS